MLTEPTEEELKEWNNKLVAEGLSVDRGLQPNIVFYTLNLNVLQSRATRTGTKGGRLRKYNLGEKTTHQHTCLRCERTFRSKRKDAKTCSVACRKALSRKLVTHNQLNIEGTGESCLL